MEPIDLVVDGESYVAMPMVDGSFDIITKDHFIGKIKPVVENAMYVKWVTADLMSAELAQKIGDAIENMEM